LAGEIKARTDRQRFGPCVAFRWPRDDRPIRRTSRKGDRLRRRRPHSGSMSGWQPHEQSPAAAGGSAESYWRGTGDPSTKMSLYGTMDSQVSLDVRFSIGDLTRIGSGDSRWCIPSIGKKRPCRCFSTCCGRRGPGDKELDHTCGRNATVDTRGWAWPSETKLRVRVTGRSGGPGLARR
jgi:hypothetical protein